MKDTTAVIYGHRFALGPDVLLARVVSMHGLQTTCKLPLAAPAARAGTISPKRLKCENKVEEKKAKLKRKPT